MKIKPSEELLAAARAAGTITQEQEFWAEVSERLDEYPAKEPIITPRALAE